MDIKQAPWQVSLQQNGTVHFCGGSIINKRWIFTAAHCLSSFQNDPTQIKVRVGATNKATDGYLVEVNKLFIHHMYNESAHSFDFDFGLLRLKKRLWFNKKVRAIQVSQFGDANINNGDKCLVSGWGETNSPNENEEQLRGGEVPIVDQKRCNQAYDGNITLRMICAGHFGDGGNNGKIKRIHKTPINKY